MPNICAILSKTLPALGMALILSALPACSKSMPPPLSVRPPAVLLQNCPPPPVNSAVLPAIAQADVSNTRKREAGLEYVRYVQNVEAAFRDCNDKQQALRDFYTGLTEISK